MKLGDNSCLLCAGERSMEFGAIVCMSVDDLVALQCGVVRH